MTTISYCYNTNNNSSAIHKRTYTVGTLVLMMLIWNVITTICGNKITPKQEQKHASDLNSDDATKCLWLQGAAEIYFICKCVRPIIAGLDTIAEVILLQLGGNRLLCCVRKKWHFICRLQLSRFLGDFYIFCTNGNSNEYSTITCKFTYLIPWWRHNCDTLQVMTV